MVERAAFDPPDLGVVRGEAYEADADRRRIDAVDREATAFQLLPVDTEFAGLGSDWDIPLLRPN